MLYYKATMSDGVSCYDRNFKYNIGLNIHPKPNKSSSLPCGGGLHLAKTLRVAKKLTSGASEFYLARAGVILAEDDEKIRCSYVWLDKLLTKKEMNLIEQEELTNHEKEERRKAMLVGLPKVPLCGQDWIDDHWFDITSDDINALRLEVKSGNYKFSIGMAMKVKDRKHLLKEAIK